MNKQVLEENWVEVKDYIRSQFPDLTEEDVRQVNGRYEQLIAKIQQRYNYSKEQAEDEVRKWVHTKNPNSMQRDKMHDKAPNYPKQDAHTNKKDDSMLKWLLLAGIPLALLISYLASQTPDTTERPTNSANNNASINNERTTTEQPADANLSQSIRRSLMNNPQAAQSLNNVRISSSNGVVTLSGTVATQEQRAQVERSIQGMNGVSRVNNQLEVRPAQ